MMNTFGHLLLKMENELVRCQAPFTNLLDTAQQDSLQLAAVP